jgi:hypothetical protein
MLRPRESRDLRLVSSNVIVKPTRTSLTKVTRSMLGMEMQSAICRRDQGAQSGAVDGG